MLWSVGFIAVCGWIPLLSMLVGIALSDSLALGKPASSFVVLGGFGIGVVPMALLFQWFVPLKAVRPDGPS